MSTYSKRSLLSTKWFNLIIKIHLQKKRFESPSKQTVVGKSFGFCQLADQPEYASFSIDVYPEIDLKMWQFQITYISLKIVKTRDCHFFPSLFPFFKSLVSPHALLPPFSFGFHAVAQLISKYVVNQI
jgi:hypothetical protein